MAHAPLFQEIFHGARSELGGSVISRAEGEIFGGVMTTFVESLRKAEREKRLIIARGRAERAGE